MNKKKTIAISVICAVAVIAAVTGVLIYMHFRPYIRLKQTTDNLLNREYEYTLDGKVEGMDLKLLGDSFEGTIKGQKGKTVVYGDIAYKDSDYLKIYADMEGDIIFDASPLIDQAINTVADSIPFGKSLIKSASSDVKISYDQVEYILNQDIKTLKDEGVSSDLMEDVSHRKSGGYTLSLLKDKDVDEKDKLLDDAAYYFEIDLKDYDTKLVVGIPKDKNDHRISANIYADKITWSFTGEYEIKAVEEIKMPEATVSDKTIDVLKSLYSSYLEITKKS